MAGLSNCRLCKETNNSVQLCCNDPLHYNGTSSCIHRVGQDGRTNVTACMMLGKCMGIRKHSACKHVSMLSIFNIHIYYIYVDIQ